MKVISAKFLNEFNKLVDKYNPDRELNEIAKRSGEVISAMGEDKGNIEALATLLNVSTMATLDSKRRKELLEFNCKAYALIHDIDLKEVEEMDYKEVNEAVKKFRNEYK